MNYHVFYDSFTDDIEHSGIFDLFFKISILENKSGDFGRVEGRFQNRCVKGSGDPNPSYPACCDPTVRSVSTAGYHRHPPSPPRMEGKNITKRTFRAAAIVVQVNKNDYYFSPLNFEFEYFFFCGLLSLKHNTLVLWYIWTFSASWKRTSVILADLIWHPSADYNLQRLTDAWMYICTLPSTDRLFRCTTTL